MPFEFPIPQQQQQQQQQRIGVARIAPGLPQLEDAAEPQGRRAIGMYQALAEHHVARRAQNLRLALTFAPMASCIEFGGIVHAFALKTGFGGTGLALQANALLPDSIRDFPQVSGLRARPCT